ncbi:MAG: T9SS type A sorting domain-containing protein [Sphingobacteriaceae bacterium]|nr:T9SS type A sorting domain-containing protein [Sphingobacteriaceae bacterium]
MHFYGSDDWNAKIDFKIGTNIMGDTMSGNSAPTINVIHNDDDGELADSIKIWSGKSGSGIDPVIIAIVKQSNTLMHTDYSVIADDTARYYLAEIKQVDGQRIITSPIWFKGKSPIGLKEHKKEITFIMFPNPTTSKLNISTGICDNYSVEIIDLSGKKIFQQNYNEPDITISTSQFEKGFYLIKVRSGNAVKQNDCSLNRPLFDLCKFYHFYYL